MPALVAARGPAGAPAEEGSGCCGQPARARLLRATMFSRT
jgi:hypothetical protein